MNFADHLDTLRYLDPLGATWVAVVLFVVLLIITATNVNSPRKWRLLAHALFRMRLGKQVMREEIDLQDRTLLALLISAVLVMGLFAWQVFVYYGVPSAPSFIIWVGIVAAVVIIQSVALRATAFFLKVDNGLGEHLYAGLLIFILAGLVLLPICVLVAYRPEWRGQLLLAGGILTALLLLFRWFRALWIGVGEGVPFRYIIIYLCAAEILPVLLLIDALRRPIDTLTNL